MKCLNCGNEFEGAYCPFCGQSAKVRRLTLATMFEGLMGALFNFDRGIWRTIGHLFSKPGTMISDYIEGKRASYVNPFSLLVILTTIFAVEAFFIGKENESDGDLILGPTQIEISSEKDAEDDGVSEVADSSGTTYSIDENVILNRYLALKDYARKSHLLHGIYDWARHNKMFYTIITIPLLALCTRVAFRKKKQREGEEARPFYNYAECLCAMAYYSCQLLCISIITMPFNPSSAKTDGFTDVGGLVMVIFLAWNFMSLYNIRKRNALVKAFSVIFLNYSLIVVIAIIIIAAVWVLSGMIS